MSIKIITIFISFLIASDQIPSADQDHPILLKNATVHTISNGIKKKTDILFDSGKIIAIGKNLNLPVDTEVINTTNKHIFPGLISASTVLGLQEIGAVRATRDYAEVGDFNPNVRANVSYNPDSELIPISRSNGVLLALSIPRSGLISGQSSLMSLDGWTWEDATFKHPVGLHLFWPSMNIPKNKKNKSNSKDDKRLTSIQKIDNIFDESRSYLKLKISNSQSFKHNLKLEGLIPVLNNEIPIFIHANEVRQIEAAVYWSIRQDVKMILVGGKDSWRVTDLLKDNNIPVIYTQTHSTPSRRFENFDQSFTTPNQLYRAGVKFCISNSESSFQTPHIRNLPYHAAKAGSYGLPWSEAIRSITLSTAEILGVNDRVGSIDIGKNATLFIADGDILDVRTQVEQVFIDGKKVDMSDRHKVLFDKYQKKYQQLNNK